MYKISPRLSHRPMLPVQSPLITILVLIFHSLKKIYSTLFLFWLYTFFIIWYGYLLALRYGRLFYTLRMSNWVFHDSQPIVACLASNESRVPGLITGGVITVIFVLISIQVASMGKINFKFTNFTRSATSSCINYNALRGKCLIIRLVIGRVTLSLDCLLYTS